MLWFSEDEEELKRSLNKSHIPVIYLNAYTSLKAWLAEAHSIHTNVCYSLIFECNERKTKLLMTQIACIAGLKKRPVGFGEEEC